MFTDDSFSSAWVLAMSIHMFFGLVLFFGLIAGAVWLARFANKAQVKTWFWVSVLLGTLGLLLTGPMTFSGMQTMMDRWDEEDEDRGAELDDLYESMDEIRDEMMNFKDDEETDVTGDAIVPSNQ